MSPATPQYRASSLHARATAIHVVLLWHPARTRSPCPSRTTASEIASSFAVAPEPRPRRLLPPIRVRRLAAERRIVMSRNKHQNRNVAATHGPLERRPLEDRNLRLARARGRRFWHRRPDR